MPVLEDGLSSGHASDTDNNNPTVMLMKRQITEIEREINQGICKSNQNNSNENGLSPKNEVLDTSPVDMNGCIGSFEEPMTISQTDSLGKNCILDTFFRKQVTYHIIKNTLMHICPPILTRRIRMLMIMLK